MKRLTSLLLFAIITSMLNSCRKCEDDPKPSPKTPLEQAQEDAQHAIETYTLPPATQVGANTMGCLIDGEVWMPLKESQSGNLSFDILYELTGAGGLNLSGRREHGEYSDELTLFASAILDSTFDYPENGENMAGNFINYLPSETCGFYILNSAYSMTNFEITKLDLENHILSGLFEMRVVSETCQDTSYITEGRFDLSGN